MFEIEAIRRSGKSEFYSYSTDWRTLDTHAKSRLSREEKDPVVAMAVYGNDGNGESRPFMFLNGHEIMDVQPASYLEWYAKEFATSPPPKPSLPNPSNPFSIVPIDGPLFRVLWRPERSMSASEVPADMIPPLHEEVPPNVRTDLRPPLRFVTDADLLEAERLKQIEKANNDREGLQAVLIIVAIVGGIVAILSWLPSIGPDTTRMSDEEYQRYQESEAIYEKSWEAMTHH